MGRPFLTHKFAVSILVIIHAVGMNAMYGLLWRNGYLDYLSKLYTQGPFLAPLTGKTILTRFTGVWPLDKLLTLAGVMFTNVLDGSTPQLSLYAFQFAGQLVPLWTVMIIEGVRAGNKANLFAWTMMWGCLMQGTGIGFIMPVYCLLHLLISPSAHSQAVKLRHATDLHPNVETVAQLPKVFVIGYVLPAVLMSVPVFPDQLHQWFAGLWQGFPILIAITTVVLKKGHQHEQNVDVTDRRLVLDTTYGFALTCASVTQLTTYAVIVSQTFMSWSPDAAKSLTFAQVFLPPPFWKVGEMSNPAIGIMNFFQYDQYVACAAGIVWASTMYADSRERGTTPQERLKLCGRLLCIAVIAGPASVVSELIRARDRELLVQ